MEVARGLVVAAGKVEPGAAVAFSDALLDQLAQQNGAQATLLSPEAALCRAGGVSGTDFAAVGAAPAEQAGALLLGWAQRLYLTDVCRVTLASGPQGAQAELLWARLGPGQVRQAQARQTQPLTRATAALLAGKVAQIVQTGWEAAIAVTSSGNPPGLETGPEVTPAAEPHPLLPPLAGEGVAEGTRPTALPAATAAPAAPSTGAPGQVATPLAQAEKPALPAVSPPAPAGHGYLDAARKALNQGEATHALDLIAAAIQSGEDRTAALLLRAQAYGKLQDPQEQRDALAAAIASDKTLYEPRLLLAGLERDRGLWQDAVALYRDAIAAQPTQAAAYVALSGLYLDQRLPAEALKVLQEGVKTAPQNLSLLYVLAGEYKRRGMLAAAEETYATLAGLASNGQKADALDELGAIYIHAREYGAAFDALRQAGEVNPAGAAAHYGELFEACDQTVGQALDSGFQALADLDSTSKPAPREQVFQRLNAALGQIQKIRDFATPLKLAEEQQEVLDQRILYYAAAFEAVTWALDYVDTGAAASKARALQRRSEAATMPAGWTRKA